MDSKMNRILWTKWFRQINKFRAHNSESNIIEFRPYQGRYSDTNIYQRVA